MDIGLESKPNPRAEGASYQPSPQLQHLPPIPQSQPFDSSTVIYNPLPATVARTTDDSSLPPPPLQAVQNPRHPSAQATIISKPNRYATASPRQVHPQPPPPATIQLAKAAVAEGLQELISLQRGGYVGVGGGGRADRFRLCCGTVLDDVKVLRDQVLYIVHEAESHRWRRLLLGGIMASVIPALRAIFRKPPHDQDSATDTEYAFHKSKSLMRRILDLGGRSLRKLATWSLIVFAAVYVFQNEVKLRVARTLAKKLKHLGIRIARSGEVDSVGVTEKDVRLLDNWRWRVLA